MIESKEELSLSPEEQLAIFNQRVNDMLDCKYILAIKRIASLLKGIVSSSILMENITNGLKNFNYATEFARNRLAVSEGDGVKIKLTLPIDKLRLFTFVFCLLAEIDFEQRDFTRFLNEYFPAENANESYKAFCQEIIVPFKLAGEFFLSEADPDAMDGEVQAKGESFFDAQTIYVPSAASDEIVTIVGKVQDKIDNDFQGNAEQRAECAAMADAFLNAVMSKNPKMINVVWIGFKNTLRQVKGFERDVAAIKNRLLEANLIG